MSASLGPQSTLVRSQDSGWSACAPGSILVSGPSVSTSSVFDPTSTKSSWPRGASWRSSWTWDSRHIGTSNTSIPKLKLLLRDARIKPACNEMEQHPCFQQPELFKFVVESGIVPIGFAPIGSPTRPDRDRTEGDAVDMQDPVIQAMAKRLGVHPATICVKWAVQRDQVPIPFSIYRNEYLSNLRSTVSEPLTEEEMKAVEGIDRNSRLIKSQVFLWKDGQSWEDLWDLDGTIAQ